MSNQNHEKPAASGKMRRLSRQMVGIDQGEIVVFSDFGNGGEMWTGRGPRERRRRISFGEPFVDPPVVHLSLSMWDLDNGAPARADLSAEAITRDGFDLVFRTWGDTRVARIRAAWMAIGEMASDEDWVLY